MVLTDTFLSSVWTHRQTSSMESRLVRCNTAAAHVCSPAHALSCWHSLTRSSPPQELK